MFYFRLHFYCNRCSERSTRVVKISSRSKFDASEKIGQIKCHLCVAPDELNLLEVEELHLAHLEEFVRWASGESKLMIDSTVEVLNAR